MYIAVVCCLLLLVAMCVGSTVTRVLMLLVVFLCLTEERGIQLHLSPWWGVF
jgi:hypothetical protein